MASIELNWSASSEDMSRMLTGLLNAVMVAVDESRRETTWLTVDGEPVAAVVPYARPSSGVQIGSGNTQFNVWLRGRNYTAVIRLEDDGQAADSVVRPGWNPDYGYGCVRGRSCRCAVRDEAGGRNPVRYG